MMQVWTLLPNHLFVMSSAARKQHGSGTHLTFHKFSQHSGGIAPELAVVYSSLALCYIFVNQFGCCCFLEDESRVFRPLICCPIKPRQTFPAPISGFNLRGGGERRGARAPGPRLKQSKREAPAAGRNDAAGKTAARRRKARSKRRIAGSAGSS